MAAELIAKVFSVGALIVGLSHLVHPRLWAEFFAEAAANRHVAFRIAIFTLPAGLLIVFAHPVWVLGPPVLITLAGWIMTLKSVAYLLFPRAGDRLVADSGAAPRRFAAAGLLMSAIGVLLVADTFFLPLAR